MSDSEEPPGGSTGPRSVVSTKSDWSKHEPQFFSRDPADSLPTEAGAMASPTAPCLFDALFGALDDVADNVFQTFKLYLMDRTLLGEFEVIKRRKLETDDKTKVLKAMMDNYGIFTISVMKTVLKELHQNRVLEELSQCQYHPEAIIAACKEDLQTKLKSKFQFLVESLSQKGQRMAFNDGYTELFITEADTGHVSEEHEVRQMEMFSGTSAQERTVLCQDIFRGTTETGDPIRAVLTKGVAGVGKTILTQKFSLDWAVGRANQDVQLLFHFTFRELNVLKKKRYSLVELIHHCFKESKKLFSFQCLQLLFIFDGLDECRLPLDFSRTRVLTDPTESASVEELLVNLIRGDLLPSARLWITTRPAAANQIPAECVSMVTEVRGFTDPQKEQYFMKRFRDEATAVISHIKSIRSLYIMSSIPVFCWILSTVLQKLLKQTEKPELPKTLTEMYIHFLVVQAKVKNIKYHGRSGADLHWTPETREMVRSLGKLAFEQLLKGNLIFYESDLSECGLDAAEIACYSGVFTEVFREEQGLYEDKVYCFIHLSVQEFLAALHVHQTFFSSGKNLLFTTHIIEYLDTEKLWSDISFYYLVPGPKTAFYWSAVDQALQSPNGHLDLFLRFLLGLSLSTNQSLLKGLLTETENDMTYQEIVAYIHHKLDEGNVSTERSLNLLQCLHELNDQSLLTHIQKYMRKGCFSDNYMSPAQWSALSFILLSSDSEEFDLKKYKASEDGLLKLLLVVKASTKAILSGCHLSPGCCSLLASVLSSSALTHLDLSNNDLQDSGVELLCEGLKSAPCRLETLSLSGCLVTERGGASLASALSSTHSPLRKLDLSYNHPGASAKLLTALQAPHGPLQMLRLDPTGARWMIPGLRKFSCEFSLDPNTAHRRLLLSEDKRTVHRVKRVQWYLHHKDRFTDHCQVLSSTGLWGRSYWEVEWSRRGMERVDIAVSYKRIQRRGHTEESGFGDNDQSWCLRIKGGQYSVSHNKQQVQLPWNLPHGTLSEVSGRVAVFLDSEAGALSFYKVSNGSLFLLHTYSTSFTEPVFPGFGLENKDSSVSVVKV